MTYIDIYLDLAINRDSRPGIEEYLENIDSNFSNELIEKKGFRNPYEEHTPEPRQATFDKPSKPSNQNSYIDLTTSDFSFEGYLINEVERPTGHLNSQVFPVFTPASRKTNSETARCNLKAEKEYSFKSAEDAYIRLIPLINNLTPKTFVKLLVEALRLCLHHIPLEDFYNLLFVDEDISASNRLDNTRMGQPTIEGLKLCRYIVDTFKFPGVDVGYFAAGLVQKSNWVAISFDHVLNTFLAVKIISDSTEKEKVDISLSSERVLSRSSIRCAYYVLCQKLFHKYKTITKSLQSRNIFLMKSHLGRIMNLLFKDLTQRRLGRRSDSQFHYFGLRWNPTIIDDEMIRLINSEEDMMKKLRESQKLVHVRIQEFEEHLRVVGQESPKSVHDSNIPNHLAVEVGEGQSFCGISNRFMELVWSPQTWQSNPPRLLSLLNWTKPLLLRSKEALCEFTIDLKPLFSTFSLQSGDENKGFFEVFRLLESLKIQNAPEKVFMHSYLVVALLILPLSLCSRDDFLGKHNLEFQINMKIFINEMKSRRESLVGWSRKGFSIFSNIIQRIYQILDLSRLEVKTSVAKDIVAEFARDMRRTTLVNQSSGETIKNEAILSAVYQTMKAFDVCHDEQAPERNSINEVKRILSIEKPFLKFFTRVEQRIRELPDKVTDEDMRRPMCNLAFHIFVVLVEEFHQECLPALECLELPNSLDIF